ncbi:putative PGG domain-containing protein [Helianthus annuus]|nr:putative PGG domain-containing protein [Helianthus annuus]KAJ0589750.1 putative PGG domain-containing protein [Helianthus annuus]KAJ0758322.1 putative PGG domain-containing protein [Helianthus annuus]KAJ0761982.1 putative PGG domain-containing protein [Helianthus annuus]KAJ0932111.1 putative ankyrin repeat-containing protein [Helianthus annuus]
MFDFDFKSQSEVSSDLEPHFDINLLTLQIVCALLNPKGTINKQVINKYGETPLDTAEKFGRSEIAIILQKHGVPKARSIKNTQPPLTPTTRELKQTVSDIKHGVHVQLEHAIRTQKRVKGIGKRINKMHLEGLNNAINSTTVVAVLIATVTFAPIFQLPGQYVDDDDPKKIPNGFSLGEGNIAANPEFIVFLIFVSLALFISQAVVVVQTSIVWLAVGVTVIGSVTLASTLGTMYYWIITHRMEAKSIKSRRMSGSVSISPLSDSENEDFRKLYAI